MAERLLVMGGTAFVGRAAVEEALRRGYEVTLFTRGVTGPGLFPDCEHVHGDRDGGLAALADGKWDIVLDSSGYVPRLVRDSAQLLAPRAGSYMFVSSLVVYGDLLNQSKEPLDETSQLAPPPETDSEDPLEGDNYGPLKVMCEREVEEAFPGRFSIFRCGSIIGPNDSVGPWGPGGFARLLMRVAQGGDVVVPTFPERPIQLMDVRDLGNFMLDCAENGTYDIFNTVGPKTTFGNVIAQELEVSQSGANPVWCDDAFLAQQKGCFPWFSPGMWVPLEGPMAALGNFDTTKVDKAGMTFRPLEETIRDTFDWWVSLGRPTEFDPPLFSAELQRAVLAAAAR